MASFSVIHRYSEPGARIKTTSFEKVPKFNGSKDSGAWRTNKQPKTFDGRQNQDAPTVGQDVARS